MNESENAPLPRAAEEAIEILKIAGESGQLRIHTNEGRVIAVTFTPQDLSMRFVWRDAEAIRNL